MSKEFKSYHAGDVFWGHSLYHEEESDEKEFIMFLTDDLQLMHISDDGSYWSLSPQYLPTAVKRLKRGYGDPVTFEEVSAAYKFGEPTEPAHVEYYPQVTWVKHKAEFHGGAWHVSEEVEDLGTVPPGNTWDITLSAVVDREGNILTVPVDVNLQVSTL